MKKIPILALAFVCGTALASTSGGFGLAVLVDDQERPEYAARGTIYVEAIRGANYSLRVTNPTPYRVAVALSVDGLNTIDAKHTDSRNAAKWIVEPYGSTVISGWQVNDRTARRFFFTGEKDSYGAALAQTENLGVIEAVFYRERQRRITVIAPRAEESSKQGAPSSAVGAAGAAPPSDDYAGTGMGGRTRHEVELVDLELEKVPAASVRIRYEFRPQLVKLGVLPPLYESPLERRERARGFGNFCPEPK